MKVWGRVSSKAQNSRFSIDIHYLPSGNRRIFSKLLCKRYIRTHAFFGFQCSVDFTRASGSHLLLVSPRHWNDDSSPQHQQRIGGGHHYHGSIRKKIHGVRRRTSGRKLQVVEDSDVLGAVEEDREATTRSLATMLGCTQSTVVSSLQLAATEKCGLDGSLMS